MQMFSRGICEVIKIYFDFQTNYFNQQRKAY